jgi:hypothetical protein
MSDDGPSRHFGCPAEFGRYWGDSGLWQADGVRRSDRAVFEKME